MAERGKWSGGERGAGFLVARRTEENENMSLWKIGAMKEIATAK